jgi:enoyl-CoA hydratase/carnithine racemase
VSHRNLRFERDKNIGTIILNRPAKRNALSLELLREMRSLFETLKARNDIKVIIIKGAGKVFSAGHDISQLVDHDVNYYKSIFEMCIEVMEKIQHIPQPVIAQVHGLATAAGCQLVAACDLAVAAEEALFGTPGVKIGLFCSTPAVPLVRAIGRKRALEMLFTGRMISAREAERYGLVNKVAPSAQLEAETKELAKKIAESSLLTLGIGKRAFYAQVNLSDSLAFEYAKEVIVNNLFTEDAKEGLSAFLEKRKPTWKEK